MKYQVKKKISSTHWQCVGSWASENQ